MKKVTAICLAVILACSFLVCASGENTGATAIKISEMTYKNEGTVPTVELSYSDPLNRTWIEVYLLKKGEVNPNMGTVEYGGETYSVVGIQTINTSDPEQYTVLEDGRIFLRTDLYFGDCDVPAEGEDVFLTVGLSDEGMEEEIGELVPFSVPAGGEAFTYTAEGEAPAE